MKGLIKKIKKDKKTFILLTIILSIGIFLRFFALKERFGFNHDQDLVAWFVKDVLVNRHLRLIGQETSTQGFFIGPLYYYLQIPFFILTKMDPIAEAWLSSIIGVIGIISSYFVFSRVFDRKTGLIATILYSFSFMVVRNDREAVMTMPVIIWSIWYFYSLFLILKDMQKSAFLLLGILLGLIWHMNVALAVTIPLIILALIITRPKKVNIKALGIGLFIALLLFSPFILFELKHGFIQINTLLQIFSGSDPDIYLGWDKLVRVLSLINRNILFLILVNTRILESFFVGIILLLGALGIIFFKKIISRKILLIITSWFILYVIFFMKFTKPISEYYLNGLFVIYLIIFSVSISYLLRNKIAKYFIIVLLIIFSVYNIQNVLVNYAKDGIHYTDKLALVKEIKKDSVNRNYPCVAISFITLPGYELGYRYLFYLQNLKIKEVSNLIPTYTVTYPLGKDAVKEDKQFGYLGLIYPEKNKYSPKLLKEACGGENVNLTKPMWGMSR